MLVTTVRTLLGRDTFAGACWSGSASRTSTRTTPSAAPVSARRTQRGGRRPLVLPDEPYRFTADDGPEAFPALPAALVDGRFLTWYGPSLAQAPAALRAALR
ncbi:helical backbone metal receptor [Streptomyces sp. NBC_01618]|uniref:helical backbone metal receptor n=1 Tax=Streptomyces sp. NBC_01618 TaxID=2975900 RepID=UPI0038684645